MRSDKFGVISALQAKAVATMYFDIVGSGISYDFVVGNSFYFAFFDSLIAVKPNKRDASWTPFG